MLVIGGSIILLGHLVTLQEHSSRKNTGWKLKSLWNSWYTHRKKERASLSNETCLLFCPAKKSIISLMPLGVGIEFVVVSTKENQINAGFHKEQLKGHVFLCMGSGIDNIIVAIIKIDLVGWLKKVLIPWKKFLKSFSVFYSMLCWTGSKYIWPIS